MPHPLEVISYTFNSISPTPWGHTTIPSFKIFVLKDLKALHAMKPSNMNFLFSYILISIDDDPSTLTQFFLVLILDG
jgi:hypothetical protein